MAIIENGIKTDRLNSRTVGRKPERSCFLSRINPKKGIENLIDAIAGLKDDVFVIQGTYCRRRRTGV
jgi:glycosyltransferase involved in cell wall biosynthesis